MEEQLKNRILIISVLIGVVGLVLAIAAGIGAQQQKAHFQNEMVSRLDTEEKLENSKFVVSALEDEIKKMQNQVVTEQTARQKAEDELMQEKLVSGALKEEIVKVNKLNDVLEQNLKDALSKKSSESTQ